MPAKIKKVDGYQVSHGGKVSAKKTTKAKAKRQANLLRAVEHGWKPTGKPARNVKKKAGKGKSSVPKKFRDYMKTRSR